MKVTFDYSLEKDVWCILNYGKSSMNSSSPTKMYNRVIESLGENPNQDAVSAFVTTYLEKNEVGTAARILAFQNDWDSISHEYQKIAEEVFRVTLPNDVTTYLTTNDRYPYDIANGIFFVPLFFKSARQTVMHELWHFYTWYRFGADWEEKLGAEKYNDIKEALTILLNVECKHLLPEGDADKGYPQHQELRQKILELWGEEKDMENLWLTLAA